MTEKLYLENPYLRQLDARITEKEYLNDKYYIKLNKTIFYPNLSGGQPGDRGTINGVEVIDTYEEDEDIIHVTRENIHSDRVSLSIDWDNRLDYMQQHSGQHLLSSVFYKLFNAETRGFYIGKDHVYIDVNLPYLKVSGAEKVEQFANKIIFSNFPIKSYLVEKDEDKNLQLNKDKSPNWSNRIVEIDGIDFTPCCGTHLRSTGEIGIIKIKDFEELDGLVRVFFICGSRALEDYRWCNKAIYSLTEGLECSSLRLVDTVKDVLEAKSQLEDENRKLKNKLLEIKSRELMKKSEAYKNINFINESLDDLSSSDLDFITSNIVSKKDYIIFLSNKAKPCSYIFATSNNLNNLAIDLGSNPYKGKTLLEDRDETMRKLFNNIIEKL